MAGGFFTLNEGDFPPLSTPKLSLQPSVEEESHKSTHVNLVVGTIPLASTSFPVNRIAQVATLQQPPHPSASSKDESIIAKAFSGKLETRPIHKINGKSCVSFKVQDKLKLLSKIKFIIVAKFSHGRPRIVDFQSFLSTLHLKGGYFISEFDVKHVFLELDNFDDFVKIWLLKSWVIKGFRVRFFQWTGDFNPAVETFIAPIWIHLPALPLFLFDEDAILSIASMFGKLLYIDPSNLDKRRVGSLSFCVARDVRNLGIEGFWIEFVGEGVFVERFWQKVLYGHVPAYCSSCFHLGHLEIECKLQKMGKENSHKADYGGNTVPDGLQRQEKAPLVQIVSRPSQDLGADCAGPSFKVNVSKEKQEVIVSKEKQDQTSGLDTALIKLKEADFDAALVEDESSEEGDLQPEMNEFIAQCKDADVGVPKEGTSSGSFNIATGSDLEKMQEGQARSMTENARHSILVAAAAIPLASAPISDVTTNIVAAPSFKPSGTADQIGAQLTVAHTCDQPLATVSPIPSSTAAQQQEGKMDTGPVISLGTAAVAPKLPEPATTAPDNQHSGLFDASRSATLPKATGLDPNAALLKSLAQPFQEREGTSPTPSSAASCPASHEVSQVLFSSPLSDDYKAASTAWSGCKEEKGGASHINTKKDVKQKKKPKTKATKQVSDSPKEPDFWLAQNRKDQSIHSLASHRGYYVDCDYERLEFSGIEQSFGNYHKDPFEEEESFEVEVDELEEYRLNKVTISPFARSTKKNKKLKNLYASD